MKVIAKRKELKTLLVTLIAALISNPMNLNEVVEAMRGRRMLTDQDSLCFEDDGVEMGIRAQWVDVTNIPSVLKALETVLQYTNECLAKTYKDFFTGDRLRAFIEMDPNQRLDQLKLWFPTETDIPKSGELPDFYTWFHRMSENHYR